MSRDAAKRAGTASSRTRAAGGAGDEAGVAAAATAAAAAAESGETPLHPLWMSRRSERLLYDALHLGLRLSPESCSPRRGRASRRARGGGTVQQRYARQQRGAGCRSDGRSGVAKYTKSWAHEVCGIYRASEDTKNDHDTGFGWERSLLVSGSESPCPCRTSAGVHLQGHWACLSCVLQSHQILLSKNLQV